ncbi:hypothetical protein [Streptomyces nigra]|uniref:hypothetical protein n=1 Tax=Streptomyces nigra TaxID=1827580 RepID=UPI0038024621
MALSNLLNHRRADAEQALLGVRATVDSLAEDFHASRLRNQVSKNLVEVLSDRNGIAERLVLQP